MKRFIKSTVLAMTFTASLFAAEWGGIVKNDTGFTNSKSTDTTTNTQTTSNVLTNSSNIFFWVSVPFNNDGSVYLKTEANYKFDLAIPLVNPITVTPRNTLDLDLFKIAGDFRNDSGNISFAFGRYSVSDLTSAVFTQNCDGIFAKYATPAIEANFYAGFTGLINGNTVSMKNSPNFVDPRTVNPDGTPKLNNDGTPFDPSSLVYSLSPKYIPLNAAVTFPSLFANQTLALQGAAFIDLNGTNYNRFYGTLSMTGPFTSAFYYSAYASASLLKDGASPMAIGLLGNASFTLFPTKTMLLSIGCKYSSWENGGLKGFTGFTANSLFTGDENGYICPAISLMTSVSSQMMISMSAKGAITPDSANGNKLSFGGISGDLSLNYNIFSDLQAGLTLTDTYLAPSGDNSISATVKAAISF